MTESGAFVRNNVAMFLEEITGVCFLRLQSSAFDEEAPYTCQAFNDILMSYSFMFSSAVRCCQFDRKSVPTPEFVLLLGL